MSEEYFADAWPTMPDGNDYDGTGLLALLSDGRSPFQGAWDVNLLIGEIEDFLGASVVDIPAVHRGANYYGLHVKLSSSLDILARISIWDVNMPNYAAGTVDRVVSGVEFEAAVYRLLSSEPELLASQMLYYRVPVQHACVTHPVVPTDIRGRSLFLFKRSEGENNVWAELPPEHQNSILYQAAHIRASLFNFNPPRDFCEDWLLDRLFEVKPYSLQIPVTSTRDFWVIVFTSKIEATIIDEEVKQSLLRLVPRILPYGDDHGSLYRLVLEHGDFGIHNISITTDLHGRPLITSLGNWQAGCIVPALLSDPLMKVHVDLNFDDDAGPLITRVDNNETPEDLSWARDYYYKALFDELPGYERLIRAGKDARHLWFALTARGGDDEGYIGRLGEWAEERMKALGAA